MTDVRQAMVAAGAVRVVHHVPGRLRVRVEGSREPAAMLQMVGPLLATLPPVSDIRINAVAGSVVIRYSGDDVDVDARAIPGSASRGLPARTIANRVFVSVAVGAAARAISRGRGALPLWVDIAVLAIDTLATAQRLRRTRGGAGHPSHGPLYRPSHSQEEHHEQSRAHPHSLFHIRPLHLPRA